MSSSPTIKKRHIKREKTTAAATNTVPNQSDARAVSIANGENADDIMNDITLELLQDDITDAYEAGGDDMILEILLKFI